MDLQAEVERLRAEVERLTQERDEHRDLTLKYRALALDAAKLAEGFRDVAQDNRQSLIIATEVINRVIAERRAGQ